jgi:hypothetical protein
MSIQALQMRVADRPSQQAGPVPATGTGAIAGAAGSSSIPQDQVQLSDQARKLSAALATAEVELQLSPARLREIMTDGTPAPGQDSQ